MKVILPVIIVLVSLLAGCPGTSSGESGSAITPAKITAASRVMGVSFPPETRFLYHHRASEHSGLLPSPDDSIALKIELPSESLEKFIRQKPMTSVPWSTSLREVTDNPGCSEWTPSKVRTFRSAQFGWADAKYLNVLIDDDAHDKKIVYLFWFET